MTGRVLTSALTRTLAPSPRRNAGTARLHPSNACASNNRGAFSTSYHTSRPVHPIRSFRSFQSFRSFASSASSDALLEELQKEVAHERSNYTQSSADAPPEPWSLTEVEGDTLMTLTRSFGKETVCVDIMINDQLEKEEQPIYFEDEETGEIEVDVSVDFVVSILKENSDLELVFECSSDGSFIEIIRVSLEPEDEDDADDEALYTGPIFDELDDTVQDAMYAFLEERGVTADLGEYLIGLSTDKEQRLYMDWLDDMSRFLRG